LSIGFVDNDCSERVDSDLLPAELQTARATVHKLATHRRSIRRYRPEPIPEADLWALLHIASRAPSAWNLNPWRFIVVRDAEAKSQLAKAAFGQSQVDAASAVIVLYSDMLASLRSVDDVLQPAWPEERREKTRAGILAHFAKMTPQQRDQWGTSQSYIALGYLLLAAEAFGLGSSPIIGFDPAKVKTQFQLPDHAEIAALIALGYPSEVGLDPHRLPIESMTRFV
jgi:nitroreductase